MLVAQDKNRQESQQRMRHELDQLSENVRKVWKRIGKSYILIYSELVCTSKNMNITLIVDIFNTKVN